MGRKPSTPPVNSDARTILWASNHPLAPSGYGTQTAQVVSRLTRDGHRVAIANNYGTEGFVSSWNGVRVYPKGLAHHSQDAIVAHTKAWAHDNTDPDPLLITLYDTWIYGDHLDPLPQVASWVPIDHTPAPEIVLRYLRKPNVTPIAMSKFGLAQIENAGIEALYAPHGLEPTWRPTSTYKGTSGRNLMRVPDDAWCITINQANKADGVIHRKAWPENLAASVEMMRRHADVWLYIHTEASPSMSGLDIRGYLDGLSAPMDRISFVDPYAYRMGIPADALAAIYTATDVLLACSMGEGFGLTPLEAQACGTPVVMSDWTAQPELCGDGWLVKGQPFWHGGSQNAWWLTPSVGEIVEALEAAYARGSGRSQKAIDFARQYDADAVYDQYWRPALKVLAP